MSKIRKPKRIEETDTFGDTISITPTKILKGVIFQTTIKPRNPKCNRVVLYNIEKINRIICKLTEIKKWTESHK